MCVVIISAIVKMTISGAVDLTACQKRLVGGAKGGHPYSCFSLFLLRIKDAIHQT